MVSSDLATCKYAMGSTEPLGTPRVHDHDTHDFGTIVLDNDQPTSPGVGASAAPRLGTAVYADSARKRKRSVFVQEDVVHMTFIPEVVKAVVESITNAAPPDFHPAMYSVVMDGSPTFIAEEKIVALSHLFDNRAQGNEFVQMAEDHMELWLRTFLGKHYYG
jgi:hypothetical protein